MSFNPYANGATVTQVGQTVNPVTNQNPDTNFAPISLGRQQEVLMAEIGGRNRVMASRGGVYFAQYAATATLIPLNTTTAPTFSLVNPVGSSVLVEPIDFQLDFLLTNAGPSTATVVGFSFVNLTTNSPSATTKIPVPTGGSKGSAGAIGGRLDQAGNQAYVASALTISALTVAANWGYSVATFPASWVPTVGGYPVPFRHDFGGKLILPPGYAMCLVASTAWGANTVIPNIAWAEYLP